MRDKIEVNLGEYKGVVGISTVTQPRPTVRTVTVGSFQQPTSHSNFLTTLPGPPQQYQRPAGRVNHMLVICVDIISGDFARSSFRLFARAHCSTRFSSVSLSRQSPVNVTCWNYNVVSSAYLCT